ncbi:hypothetical protein QKT49_gp187 [Acanthamoeba castellanii medusavirus]|uniref:Uncharacterized protein n=1 Tax=Acanthamoeba castellanii medusavirus J1 TaxID=3114988 RepID=A0A3T1CXL7_9VIRU|nr:hypothetical protein QKT49_gp187 [Acanthamoeba castellanii medusavirus]BBI30576.1 hypothetical protein [Acanthamoeba castellanii medusavirus J1]
MSEYITPTNGLLVGAGALIVVLAYLLIQQRKDARYGKRIRKGVIKAVVEMGCKQKGDKIVCPKPLAGLGDSFKVDDAISRSLDQFCDLIRQKEAPSPPPQQHDQAALHQLAQQGFHDMARAPMPTAMAMPAMPIPGGGGGQPMMPYMPPQPQQPMMPPQSMMQPGFAGAFESVTGQGAMMGGSDAPKPLPFQPISTREDRNMPMVGGGMVSPQYNPGVF